MTKKTGQRGTVTKTLKAKVTRTIRKVEKEAGVPPKLRTPAVYHGKKSGKTAAAAKKPRVVADKMLEDVMVDLETTGQGPGCAILSIGAVFFHQTHGLGEEFHKIIALESCKPYDLRADPATMQWWDKQSEEARRTLLIAQGAKVKGIAEKPIEIWRALNAFTDWLDAVGPGADRVKVWGNGSDFDNAILAFCYKATNRPLPWKFWNNRCFRTLKSLRPDVQVPRQGTYHNALDDAKTQALHAIELLGKMKGA